MKKLIFIVLGLLKFNLCICQEVKLNLKGQLTVEDTQTIELFECNRAAHDCEDQKAVSIITGNELSPCFKLVKILNEADSKKLIKILRSKETYQVNPYYAFTTDYGIVILTKKKP